MSDLSPEFLALLEQVQGKRARIVVEHILEHGYITTADLENIYGYSHPPRAVRDVREQGIPLETFRVKNEQGRMIAAYRFGNLAKAESGKLGGRKIFSKAFKQALLNDYQERCAICHTPYESRYLQIDHRIPYEVAGENPSTNLAEYMPLCASCNRVKSWSCEHCENSLSHKDSQICKTCYWAYPQHYEHIAMQTLRRLELVFTMGEIPLYEWLANQAQVANLSLADFIKALIAKLSKED